MATQPRVWSLWIYDRHCSLLFHADWSVFHARTSTSNSTNATASGSTTNGSTLSLSEQSKLVYGVVFSLRNMSRKLSPQHTESSAPTVGKESFHSFSTASYTLSHLQTGTNYTFILLTDPVAPPTRRAPSGNASITSSTFSGGGGIPNTGGMSTTGVLSQIARGPWVDFVARNAACLALERMSDEDDDDDEEEEEAIIDNELRDGNGQSEAERIDQRRLERRKAKEKERQRQRMTGIGKSIDSEAFQAAVERVLAQNKLNAPRM